MDYGRYKYQAAQRAKESRKKSTNVVVKEMKYRPKIGLADFETKTRRVERFLGEGHKVKVTIMFRGREMQHPELGKRILDDVAEHVVHLGRVEVYPKLDGRNMTMVLAPDKKAQAAHEAELKRSTDGPVPDQGVPDASSIEADAVVDTAVVDTAVSDTAVSDTAVSDTAVSDNGDSTENT
jgi:translation initiation factor IF-3